MFYIRYLCESLAFSLHSVLFFAKNVEQGGNIVGEVIQFPDKGNQYKGTLLSLSVTVQTTPLDSGVWYRVKSFDTNGWEDWIKAEDEECD